MPLQIQSETKTARSAKLIALSEQCEKAFGSGYIGKSLPVLFEHKNGDYFEGHTSNYINVWVKTNDEIKNQMKNVYIEQYENERAYGRLN